MLTIARLFGKSPFATLLTHMNKVGNCIEKLTKMIEVVSKQETDKIERLAQEISSLEHEADINKNDIRNHLPKSIFLPIDRGHFLEILSLQDAIADKAEEVSHLFLLKPLDLHKHISIDYQTLYAKNASVYWDAKQVIAEIDELLESSFGGIEAEKVKAMVENIAYKEHEASLFRHKCLQYLFSEGDNLSSSIFFLHLKLIEEISQIAQLSEKLANRIRMVLELK
ncbi:MAG: TIGR00153 family protein [Rhabdochlamydiaceae bacterium]